MKKNQLSIMVLVLFLLTTACNPTPEIDNINMLDGNQIFDLSLVDPSKYLVSSYLPNPTDLQKDTPVIIAAHGYTATTFEWDELRDYANTNKTFYVSQVLLGGHGRTYEDFKKSSWTDWQKSIMDEYIKLSNLGFRNISLAGSSTGAPLIIQMVKSGFFDSYTQPKSIFLIDPIIVSGNKSLTMAGLLGPVLGYTTVILDDGEKGKWYIYRPQETLNELMDLINICRRDLEKGIKLPLNTTMKVYKSRVDETADPVSAVMIYKGMKTADNKNVQVVMVDSKLHVFTRLRGRKLVTSKDSINQKNTFADIESIMTH